MPRSRRASVNLLHAGRIVLGAAAGDRAAEPRRGDPQREALLRVGDAGGHGDLEAPDVVVPVVQRQLHAGAALPGAVVLRGAEALAAREHDRRIGGAERLLERAERRGQQLVGRQDVEGRVDHRPQARKEIPLPYVAVPLGAHDPRRLPSGTFALRV
jgi:hypothetical protein